MCAHICAMCIWTHIHRKRYNKVGGGTVAYTQAGNKAAQKYVKEHRDRINITGAKGLRDKWQTAAQAAGQSMTAYVMQAVEERMQREQANK